MADVPLMTNPMTTDGDIIQGGASGAASRLAIGTAGQILKVNAGATALEYGAAAPSFAAWTSYTPTWTSETSGTPSVGNGTLEAAYLTSGKLHFFRIRLAWGSTTTGGSGRWNFSLGGSVSTLGLAQQIVVAYFIDNSAGEPFAGAGWIAASATPVVRPAPNALGSINGISTTIPFTWATSDQLHLQGVIEVA